MRVLSVSWDPERDVTTLKFTAEFLSYDWIVKADVLKDIFYVIQKINDEILEEERHV